MMILHREGWILKIIKVLLAISVIALALVSQFNESMNVSWILLFLLGALLLAMGAEQLQKKQRSIGYILILTAFFNFAVSLKIAL